MGNGDPQKGDRDLKIEGTEIQRVGDRDPERRGQRSGLLEA